MSMVKQDIEQLRHYFLSHNKEVRIQVRSLLTGILLKYLSIVEDGFLRNISIENIATNIKADHHLPELKQLQFDYYTSLAQIYLNGESNEEIKLLLLNKNILFKEIVAAVLNNEAFEKELSFAIRLTEREQLKKKLQLADAYDNFELPEEEIKTAVTEVERTNFKKLFREIDEQEFKETMPEEVVSQTHSKSSIANSAQFSKVISFKSFFRYAAVAIVFGFVAFSGYYLMTSKSPDKKNANTNLSSNDHMEIAIPNFTIIPEQKTKAYSVLAPESFGIFTPKKVKIIITVINTGKYIRQTQVYLDSLKRSFTMELNSNPKAGYGGVYNEIYTIMDSLKRMLDLETSQLNTYTFNQKTGRIILYLSDDIQVDKVMSVNPADRSVFYIQLKKEFYKIQSAIKSKRLIPESNKAIIEELNKIEFQNS